MRNKSSKWKDIVTKMSWGRLEIWIKLEQIKIATSHETKSNPLKDLVDSEKTTTDTLHNHIKRVNSINHLDYPKVFIELLLKTYRDAQRKQSEQECRCLTYAPYTTFGLPCPMCTRHTHSRWKKLFNVEAEITRGGYIKADDSVWTHISSATVKYECSY